LGDRCQPWRHPRPHPGLRPGRASSRTRAAPSSDCRRHGCDIPAGRPSCPRTSPQPRSDLRLVAPLPRPDGRPTLGHRLHTPIRGDTASATPAAIGTPTCSTPAPAVGPQAPRSSTARSAFPRCSLTYPGDWLTSPRTARRSSVTSPRSPSGTSAPGASRWSASGSATWHVSKVSRCPQRCSPKAPPPHRRRDLPARAGSSGARGAKRCSGPLAAGGPVCAPSWRRRGGGGADSHLRARVPERSDAVRARACRVGGGALARVRSVSTPRASRQSVSPPARSSARSSRVSAPCRWR
jgi:hypothetical protein